jgi:hypothetical protein
MKTIGHAISLASSGDSIMVAAATYTENLTIRINLKVIGAGASTTIIDGGAINSVFTIPGGIVTLSGVTIRNGLAQSGGGINHTSGNLTVIRCTITGNETFYTSSGNHGGGGIYNSTLLTVNNSTISGNVVNDIFATGGGIANFTADSGTAAATVSNSTITGNSVRLVGGGIETSGTLTINNSTISGNSSGVGVGGSGTATLQNSIVANSTEGGNCFGTMTSNGYNLSSDGSCNLTGPGDLNNTDPKLGTLGNYGGPTQTIPLLNGSPAIDAGNPSGCTDGQGHLLTTDQRGKPRPDKEDTGGCDMGAYERQQD